jgi:hypothetical protein
LLREHGPWRGDSQRQYCEISNDANQFSSHNNLVIAVCRLLTKPN